MSEEPLFSTLTLYILTIIISLIMEFNIMDIKIHIYYGIAYLISIIGSQFVVKYILDNMWKKVYLEIKKIDNNKKFEEIRPFLHTPKILGLLESILYTTAFLIGKYEFISVWLVIKVAGSFKREFKSNDQGEQYEREKYNIFLIGNGLLILFSYIGALICRWLMEDNKRCFSIIIVCGGLILLSLIMYIVSKCLLVDKNTKV